MSEISAITFCNLTRSSTPQFPDSYILNHRIIAASFVEKGSQQKTGRNRPVFLFV